MKFTNLHILVARPKEKAHKLSQAIYQQGGTTTLFPTMVIEPLPQKSYLSVLETMQKEDIAIFVSTNAAKIIADIWPNRGTMVIAIGPSTQRTLETGGISVSDIPNQCFNSEGVLALPSLNRVKDKHLLIFGGANVRRLLDDTLSKRGAKVTRVDVYRRVLPHYRNDELPPAILTHNVDIIVSTSCENLSNLWQLLDPQGQAWLQRTPLLVISDAMHRLAGKHGITKIITAQNATDAAIMATLEKFARKT